MAVERQKVDTAIGLQRLKKVVNAACEEYGLEPLLLYSTDSAAEEIVGVPEVRCYGGSSDLDVVAGEPKGLSIKEIEAVEKTIQSQLVNSGIDFAFAPEEELEQGNAYGRVCLPLNLK